MDLDPRQTNCSTFARPLFLPERNLILLPDEHAFRQIAPPQTPTIPVPLKDGSYEYMLVARNTPAMNQLLSNLGHGIPSPILFDKDWTWAGQQPFKTQKATAALMVARNRAYILNALGTGKTLAALLAIQWLFDRKHARRALVVAPLSTLNSVWFNEVRLRMPRLRAVVLHGDRRKRYELLMADTWNVAIINPDGVKTLQTALLQTRFDIAVIDELATYRERRTDRWRKLKPIVETTPWVWGMTGSPTPNSPADVYGQIKLLQPGKLGNSYVRFRDTVCYEVSQGRWLPRESSENVVHRLMQPAVRFKLSQVVELPETLHLTRTTTNSAMQTELIKDLKTDLIAQFAAGDVTAVNAAVLMGKLLQAHIGAVYTTTKQVVDLEATARVETLREIMEEAEAKVLVFLPYRHLTELLPKKLGEKVERNSSWAVVHGGTPERIRTEVFRDFQDPNARLRRIYAHPGTMAHGLTLTEADLIIWYGPITSFETYDQANGRITRVGQKRVQRIVHITSGAVENRVYKSLQDRANMTAAILKMFEEGLN